MALRAVVTGFTNAHPQGASGAIVSIRIAFLEDGFGDLADVDVSVDFSTPAQIPTQVQNAVVAYALATYGKTLLGTNLFMPVYQRGT